MQQWKVAIQLFAEYNFWFQISRNTKCLAYVAIQLFAEYNFWYYIHNI